jgi:hypothetical protein
VSRCGGIGNTVCPGDGSILHLREKGDKSNYNCYACNGSVVYSRLKELGNVEFNESEKKCGKLIQEKMEAVASTYDKANSQVEIEMLQVVECLKCKSDELEDRLKAIPLSDWNSRVQKRQFRCSSCATTHNHKYFIERGTMPMSDNPRKKKDRPAAMKKIAVTYLQRT